MREVVDYTVVSSSNTTDLVRNVRYLVKDGWQPLGGAATATGGFENRLVLITQAMVKYKKKVKS